MRDFHPEPDNSRDEKNTQAESASPRVPRTGGKAKRSLSMHDGVPVWYDCCSCEAEPYWLAVAGDPDTSNTD